MSIRHAGGMTATIDRTEPSTRRAATSRRPTATSRRARRGSRCARRSPPPAPSSTPGSAATRRRPHYGAAVDAARGRPSRGSSASTPARSPSARRSRCSPASSPASAPDGAEIVCVDGDFSSMVVPFARAGAPRGHRACTLRSTRLAEAIGPRTWLVAFSLVQSATGAHRRRGRGARRRRPARRPHLRRPHPGRRLAARRRRPLRRHRLPRLQVAVRAARLGVPHRRRPDARRTAPRAGRLVRGRRPVELLLRTRHANWPTDARRFDVSPAWPVWPGTAAALEFFADARHRRGARARRPASATR